MRTLADINNGETVLITKIQAEKDLRQRLHSFGVRKNVSAKVINHSIAKSTIEIEVVTTKIALRLEEAKQIEVA
jgi:ferrous iron transport protein A